MLINRLQDKEHIMEAKRQGQMDVPGAIQQHQRQPPSTWPPPKLIHEQRPQVKTRLHTIKDISEWKGITIK